MESSDITQERQAIDQKVLTYCATKTSLQGDSVGTPVAQWISEATHRPGSVVVLVRQYDQLIAFKPAATLPDREESSMKRIAIVIAVMVFSSSIAFAAERSPDRLNVKLARNVPRQCIEIGSVESGGVKYTCTKIDTSEVWNDVELKRFDKDIFEAYRQELPTPPPARVRIGLVVRQDSIETEKQIQKVDVDKERNEVAFVERRDGYKYRYTRK